MSVRWWFGLIAASCGIAFAYRGDLAASAVAEAIALVPPVLWARGWWLQGKMAAKAAMIREEPEPEPVPVLRVVRAPFSHPPWETAPVPVVPAVTDRGGLEVGGRHRRERGLREAAAEVVTAAARVPLP